MEPNIKYDENQPVYDIIDYERFTFQSGYVKCKQLVIIVNAICAVLTRADDQKETGTICFRKIIYGKEITAKHIVKIFSFKVSNLFADNND
ncbi:unnamed protein product [Rhizophagus irregularis]|nr:unnamed protein product [Rhizophagus irregularis]CAB5391799.1 unnamed protein product [Rhizophagus irregularis]